MRFIRNLFIAAALLSWRGWRPEEALAVGAVLALLPRLFRRRVKKVAALDRVLFTWPSGDAFTVRDLVQSVVIIGQIGSGKTSGSGKHIAHAMNGCGALILASKPEDRDDWIAIARKLGKKLVIFAEDTNYRVNMIGYELSSGGDARTLSKFISVVGETIEGKEGGEGRDAFWEKSKDRVIYNAVEGVRQGLGQITAAHLLEFVSTAATSPAQLKDDGWRSQFHAQVLYKASKASKTQIEQYDYELLKTFWMKEYPTMADKTRTSILAVVMNTLHVLNTGIVRDKISTSTNVSPADLRAGTWVLIDYPVSKYDASGKAIMAGWKFLVQRDLLRRKVSPGDCPVVIWSDEAQNLINSYDAKFMAECRSHLGCQVFLTQSLHSFYGAMDKHHHQAEALLTNFSTKIFHTIGDAKTAEWASGLLGQRLETMTGGGQGEPMGPIDVIFGQSPYRGSFNETYQPVLQPRQFMTGLRSSGGVVDGIVVRSGKPFATGENYLRVAFKQG